MCKAISHNHIVLGKSPGETLFKKQRGSYSFEAQKKACIIFFNRKHSACEKMCLRPDSVIKGVI